MNAAGKIPYVALFNGSDKECKEADGNERCWVCHNEHGVLQSEERHGLGNG